MTRQVLVAGIAGACLLGVGAGLWARPAAQDQRQETPAAKYVAKPAGKLEIVVVRDDAGPVESVRTAAREQAFVTATMAPPPAQATPETLAPMRPTNGLMRVQNPGPPAPDAAPLEQARPDKARAAELRAEKAQLERVKAETRARRKAELAIAEAKKAEKARTRPDIRLAKAADEAATEVSDTRRPGRLIRLKTVIAKPFKAKKSGEVETAAAEEPRVAKGKKPKAEEIKLAKAEAPKAKKSGASKRCVSADPGAAIVCADPALGAADRQLSRAYREAEAAGVPGWQLKQQQQRWLAARAAAAREAPWAVHDVYLARIAELNDMTRDARTDD